MQNPNVKNTLSPPGFQQKLKYYGESLAKFLLGIAVSVGKGTEVARNNYNLGIRHLGLGNYSDAIFRFKMVTWIEPENAEAWYQLGTSYLADNQNTVAASCYRKTLSMKPDHEEAAYMLALARGARATADEMPRKIPLSLVLAHFETQAPTYNADQLERRGYKGHALIASAVKTAATAGRVDYSVLDLGVGTGLIAPLIRPIASQATGVDISEKMLAEAAKAKDDKNKRAYDSLIKAEAATFLKESPAAEYDIVIAGGLFSFVGVLDDMFKGISTALRPGGIFAFTAESHEGEGYKFDTQAARFRFSRQYLERLASANGLSEISLEQVDVYPAQKMWLGVFKK